MSEQVKPEDVKLEPGEHTLIVYVTVGIKSAPDKHTIFTELTNDAAKALEHQSAMRKDTCHMVHTHKHLLVLGCKTCAARAKEKPPTPEQAEDAEFEYSRAWGGLKGILEKLQETYGQVSIQRMLEIMKELEEKGGQDWDEAVRERNDCTHSWHIDDAADTPTCPRCDEEGTRG